MSTDDKILSCGCLCEPHSSEALQRQIMAMVDIADIFRPLVKVVLLAKNVWDPEVMDEETAGLVRLWLNKLTRFRCPVGALSPDLNDDFLPHSSELTDEDLDLVKILTRGEVYELLRIIADRPEERKNMLRAALVYLAS
ncbi:hypothetical protein KKF05_02990 [Patescibacteria group bacterium]|nr:hypothetical protein [Patescibacteria group bacterium]MBU1028606.1 hypothetical protein [Patescibacteria group bacterium]MBU1915564.1 hypothetical protein [Patescibacteria group bacterium]